uniref:Uncharacterized protein n=1 Tax=Arundo donax TaxID=35708 RepID=A0A0A9AXE4_ARUDO
MNKDSRNIMLWPSKDSRKHRQIGDKYTSN